jgi:chromosomal replication initiation ATPase DnaA
VALPDLASRLRGIASVEIRVPDDSLLRSLLARLLADRQLAVPEAVQDWLCRRLPRTPAAMREAAARLDRAALIAGRRVTRAIAAEVIRHMLVPDGQEVADHEVFAAPLPSASTATPCLL